MRAVKTLPTSIMEKTYWPEENPRRKKGVSEDLEGDKLPPVPDQDLRATDFFKNASGCSQFVLQTA